MRLIVNGGWATESSKSKGSVVVGVRTLSEAGRVGNFSREQQHGNASVAWLLLQHGEHGEQGDDWRPHLCKLKAQERRRDRDKATHTIHARRRGRNPKLAGEPSLSSSSSILLHQTSSLQINAMEKTRTSRQSCRHLSFSSPSPENGAAAGSPVAAIRVGRDPLWV
ncbi:hypothetical protein ACLB2K_002484 [Fragaria x ananassa]